MVKKVYTKKYCSNSDYIHNFLPSKGISFFFSQIDFYCAFVQKSLQTVNFCTEMNFTEKSMHPVGFSWFL